MVYEIGFTTVLCNISQDYISDLAECMLRSDDEDFGLECLGVMGNLTIPDLDYELILREYELVPWIKQKLQPGIIVFFVISFSVGSAWSFGFSSLPQRPMTYNFKRFLYQILSISIFVLSV